MTILDITRGIAVRAPIRQLDAAPANMAELRRVDPGAYDTRIRQLTELQGQQSFKPMAKWKMLDSAGLMDEIDLMLRSATLPRP